ncbi:very short patch repair endonuclease [Planococcus sp. N028]|uniref:Very short patch repair endonuclease n=1 Tax=Planococcus shixiaomingii TaxID=3058393 RepID=A0ABT8N388_9BACL|nr:very short patch repair endonuclease [Planococcus sp. N028]MDN7242213.1 very short patch repair endonuclease [Planococcus sp. N028]
MADIMSKEQRSKTMGAIRAQSKLENIFTKRLWSRGLRFRKNVRKLRGTPDIVIQKYKIVIFIDSCFWHGCPLHFKRPKSNQEFWDKKIARNRERDNEVDEYYIEKNWNLKRIWEHEIRADLEAAVDETMEFINLVKHAPKPSEIAEEEKT